MTESKDAVNVLHISVSSAAVGKGKESYFCSPWEHCALPYEDDSRVGIGCVLILTRCAFVIGLFFVRVLVYTIQWGRKMYGSLLDEHNSPQWYEIVHFEHKFHGFTLGFPKRP